MQIVWEDKEKTMEKVISFLEQAKSEKSDIVFFPEMTLTGFSMEVDKTRDLYTGETKERFQKVCKESGVAAGFGWVEQETGKKARNHYTILDDKGAVLSDYVKIHPFGYGGETEYFEGGNEIRSCCFKGHKIAAAICYDLRFPELFRIMDRDCSIAVVPANWPASRRDHWNCLLQARAIENQIYVIGVNCTGNMNGVSYTGDSAVLNPNGVQLVHIYEEEKLIVVDIPNDVEEYRKKFPVLQDQKIEIRKLDNDNHKCMYDCEK